MRKIPPHITHIVGIDEAGRGPLAGPVAVGAFCIPVNFDRKFFIKVMDSKQLSHEKREEWFNKIKDLQKKGEIQCKVALIGSETIDTQGISYAVRLGIRRVLDRLKIDPEKTLVLLDGSLKAPKEFIYQETIIKGDAKEPVIGCASIMAKVTRDCYMVRQAKIFPKYTFDIHKGYGTSLHRKSIKKLGPCSIHRLSFLKNLLNK
ncbi:MAG: ribonuclease ribonuclease [Candidatus Parcubacteria bacterium]